MSIYLNQNQSECPFTTKDSWVILSKIEHSIKRKIESVGTALKEWDIKIYRGVLTGCNEAFIISTEKRNEILNSCVSDDERKRTEEIIRPILRGRDIKRYGYNWDDKWLIATFPSRHYDIDLYPSLKSYLLKFGKEQLEQSGKQHLINGNLVKSRKKTNNQWFETQDSIAYWEDFYKPKIIYPETTQGAYFALDQNNFLLDKTCFMLLSDNSIYLQKVLSSKLYEFAYKRLFSSIELGEKGYQYNKHALIKLPILKDPSAMAEIENCNDNNLLNIKLYELYTLTNDEITLIESYFLTTGTDET